VLGLVREGKLRGLAVTSPKRSATVPELPTIAESGYPGFDVTSWFALMAPAGTPPDIIAKLHAETVKAMATPEVREKLVALGMELIGNTPAEFAAAIKAQIPEREKALKASGIKLQ
jgi:tripartite-type tricarboxylate transporter receptor subunit TctC